DLQVSEELVDGGSFLPVSRVIREYCNDGAGQPRKTSTLRVDRDAGVASTNGKCRKKEMRLWPRIVLSPLAMVHEYTHPRARAPVPQGAGATSLPPRGVGGGAPAFFAFVGADLGDVAVAN